jgi:TP901 family phage tail tape measure protein
MIDGKQAISELGKLEMESTDLRNTMKDLKKVTEEYKQTASQLGEVRKQKQALNQEAKGLKESLKELKKGTDEYKTTASKLDTVKKQMSDLDAKAGTLKKSILSIKAANEEYRQSGNKLDQVGQKIAALRQEMGVAGMTLKQMKSYARELNNEFENVTKGTKRYDELKHKLQEVNGAMSKQRADARGSTEAFNPLKSMAGMGAMGGLFAAGSMAVSGVSKLVENAFPATLKLSDELSDIQKTTGMTKQEVKDLNNELSKVNTRSTTEELRKIAAIGGQLDVAKEEVEGFTKATDKLNVALGDEFSGGVEEVTKTTGALRNIFTDIKSKKVDQDMLRIGNALNELGADGAATAPVVADFSSRIGGVGITLGMTSGQVLGLSATLQELNVSTERGGTAVSGILQKMAAAPAVFAKVAGMSSKDFKALVDKDIFAAFTKVVEGANKSSASATNFAKLLDELKLDGAGASEVIAKLGSNTQMLSQKVALSNSALQNTNSIMDEFKIKNENAAASWEKIKKFFSEALVSTAFMSSLEAGLGKLADLFDMRPEAEKLTEAFHEQKDAVVNLEKNTLPLLDRYDELKSKTTLNKEEQAELDKIIGQVATTIPTAITEFDAYGRAMGINTEKAREFIEMQRGILKIKNADAIDSQTDALKKLEKQIDQVRKALSLKDQDGDLIKKVQSTYGMGGTVTNTYKLTGEEIAALQAQLAKLQDRSKWTKGYIDELSGGNLADPKMKLAAANPSWEQGQLPPMISDAERKKAEKELADRLKLEADYYARKAAMEIELISNEQERRIAQANWRASQEMAEVANSKASAEVKKDLLTTLGKKLEHDLLEIEKEYAEKRRVESEKMAQEAVRIAQDTTKKKADIAIAYASMDESQARLNYDRLKNSRNEEAMHLAESFRMKTEYEEKARAKQREIEATQREMDQRQRDYEREKLKNPDAIEPTAVIEAEKAKKQALIDELFLLEDQHQQNVYNLEEDYRGRRIERDKQVADQVLGYMQTGLGALFDFKKISLDKEQQAESRAKTQRIKSLDSELKAGKITKEEYEKAKSTIEANYDAKTRQLKRKQAEAEKANNVAQAIMAGALAVIKASQNPLGFFSPTAIATAAMSAINIAKVVSTPVPEFAEGGGTGPINNISKGGSVTQPYLALVGEKGSEYIVPNWMLQDPLVADTVRMLEAIRTRGFASGGMTSTPAPSFSSASSSASGSGESTATSSDSTEPAWVSKLIANLDRMNYNLENPVPSSAIFDFDYFQKQESRIDATKRAAGVKKALK